MSRNKLMKGFEVEWITDVPVNEFGDADYDAATYHTADFADLEKAREYAKKVLPLDFCGSVHITPYELVPYVPGRPGLYKEYTGEVEHIESGAES